MNDLMKFLEDREGFDAWFLLASGLVSGTLNTLKSKEPDTITLIDAVYFTGEITANLDVATIFVSQIIGWGDNIVTFNDKEE